MTDKFEGLLNDFERAVRLQVEMLSGSEGEFQAAMLANAVAPTVMPEPTPMCVGFPSGEGVLCYE